MSGFLVEVFAASTTREEVALALPLFGSNEESRRREKCL